VCNDLGDYSYPPLIDAKPAFIIIAMGPSSFFIAIFSYLFDTLPILIKGSLRPFSELVPSTLMRSSLSSLSFYFLTTIGIGVNGGCS
jgi:hypothetical protein